MTYTLLSALSTATLPPPRSVGIFLLSLTSLNNSHLLADMLYRYNLLLRPLSGQPPNMMMYDSFVFLSLYDVIPKYDREPGDSPVAVAVASICFHSFVLVS